MQPPAPLNLVIVRPVGYLVQADFTDPGASRIVDCCPGSKAALTPLAQGVLERAHHSLMAARAATADVARHAGPPATVWLCAPAATAVNRCMNTLLAADSQAGDRRAEQQDKPDGRH